MTGKYLINLDSEDEGQIFVSCAGGNSTTATFSLDREQAPEDYFFMEASLKGLVGVILVMTLTRSVRMQSKSLHVSFIWNKTN